MNLRESVDRQRIERFLIPFTDLAATNAFFL